MEDLSEVKVMKLSILFFVYRFRKRDGSVRTEKNMERGEEVCVKGNGF